MTPRPPQLTYEVTTEVRAELREAYERYMRDRHIPDVLQTGCFASASLSTSAPGRYRVRYEAWHRDALDAYLRDHAAELRAHFSTTFPHGIEVTREEWVVLEAWNGPRDGPSESGTTPAGHRRTGATPVLVVSNIAATMQWYRDALGFDGEAFPPSPPHTFAILRRDGAELFLQQLDDYQHPDRYDRRDGGVWDVYLQLSDVNALYDAMSRVPAITMLQPLREQPYGQREFEIRDPNGYVLVIAQPSAGASAAVPD
jgi:uncharacterized glyoxalase superfamily protein PhnB